MNESDLIKEALEQAKDAAEADKDNRDSAVKDLEFVFAEDQWDDTVKTERAGRPCLNANDLPIFLDQVVGDQRMNRPGIKLLPVDDKTDKKKAEIIGGLIRNIEHTTDAHVAYDKAIEHSAACAYGAIRVITQYETDDLFNRDGVLDTDLGEAAFNQEIAVRPVDNPLNVLYDPAAKLWHRNDGMFMFVFDDVPIESFRKQYPKAQIIDFEAPELPETLVDWGSAKDKTIRVAEWFRKESVGKKEVYWVIGDDEIGYLTDEKPKDESRIQKSRAVESYKIIWRKISGKEILEGGEKGVLWPSKYFPVIPVWGKEININGKVKRRGMFRYVKDPQRMYIYTQSAITEMLALAPKAPWVGTVKMFEGHEDKWKRANKENWPYLPFNPDPEAAGLTPKRQEPPQLSSGLIEQAATRQAEKKDIIGLHNASLGKTSNETSGKAISERKREGDTVTYAFHDNLLLAVKQVGRVIDDLRPSIYDTPRILRMMGEDGKELMQPINQEWDKDGVMQPAIDLTTGKHDIVVQAGPGYATQRVETLDRLQNVMQYAPNIAPLIADLYIDLMDMPGGDKIVKRLEASLPPEIKAAISEAKGDGSMTPEQMKVMVEQAVMEYAQSLDGQEKQFKIQQEQLKTEREALRKEQEQVELDQKLVELERKRIELAMAPEKIKETVAGMVANGEL